MEFLRNQHVLSFALEVDDDVAAHEEMDVLEWRLGPQAGRCTEKSRDAGPPAASCACPPPPGSSAHGARPACRQERSRHRARARPRRDTSASMSVPTIDTDSSCARWFVSAACLCMRIANGVRLLSRRAARAPDAELPLTPIPQRGNDLLLDDGVGLPVAEELRDVDRERSHETLVLPRIGVENSRVLGVARRAFRAHPNGDAPAQALVLVAGALKSAVARDLVHERPKFPVVALDQHRSAFRIGWSVAPRFDPRAKFPRGPPTDCGAAATVPAPAPVPFRRCLARAHTLPA